MADLIRGPWAETNETEWSIDTGAGNTYTAIVDCDGNEVAIVAVDHSFDKDDELDAKAALISTAPDLLAFVRKVLDFARESGDEGLYAEADALIEKAEGRS